MLFFAADYLKCVPAIDLFSRLIEILSTIMRKGRSHLFH